MHYLKFLILIIIWFDCFGCKTTDQNSSDQVIKELRVNNKVILNSDDEEVLLKGVNVGQWLLMEGFMSGSNGNMTQGDMKRKLFNSGQTPEEIELFFQKWRDNYITREDVDFIASIGFNAIRVPLHYELFLTDEQRKLRSDVVYFDGNEKLSKYNTYKESLRTWVSNNELATSEDLDGFKIIDDLISWCQPNDIYLILDMHAVPGTVGDNSPITDQLFSAKDFFNDVRNQSALNRIWDKISERYKDENTIAIYDLINEPHRLTESDMGILRNTFEGIINSIRDNNDNTMIIVQGGEFGNQYQKNGGANSLYPNDFSNNSNLVYSIHRYRLPNNLTESNPWNQQNHVAYFADAIKFQNQYNVPMFVGETGLDSDYDRLKDNFDTMEDLSFGYTLWSYKYHTDRNVNRSPAHLLGNNPWDDLSQWIDGSLFENIKFENTVINPEINYWIAVRPE